MNTPSGDFATIFSRCRMLSAVASSSVCSVTNHCRERVRPVVRFLHGEVHEFVDRLRHLFLVRVTTSSNTLTGSPKSAGGLLMAAKTTRPPASLM
jgi:hypothetical protein